MKLRIVKRRTLFLKPCLENLKTIEERKIFDRFDMLGSSIDVLGIFDKITKVKPEEVNIPIPFKLAGMHVAYEKNFDWIVPENLFDESSRTKSAERGSSKTTIDIIKCLVEKTSSIDLNAPPLDNT